MTDGSLPLYSVIAGLAVGIAFLVLMASIFQTSTFPNQRFPPDPIRFPLRDSMVKIALQNSTLHDVVENRELVPTIYRDQGVGHGLYDCLNKGCALIVFADKSDREKMLVSVLVNIESKKVTGIDAAPYLLISKAGNIEEAKFFLSEYPDAIVSTNPGYGYRDVLYEAGFQGPVLSLQVRMTPTGEVIEVSAMCSGRGPTFTVTNEVMEFLKTTDCIA